MKFIRNSNNGYSFVSRFLSQTHFQNNAARNIARDQLYARYESMIERQASYRMAQQLAGGGSNGRSDGLRSTTITVVSSPILSRPRSSM